MIHDEILKGRKQRLEQNREQKLLEEDFQLLKLEQQKVTMKLFRE